MGLLLYSSHGGWSAVDRDAGDPRPASMDPAVGFLWVVVPTHACVDRLSELSIALGVQYMP